MNTDPVLRLQGITKRFGRLVANDAISLDLQRGEVLALLGENGAGKSTLVSILFGHYRADEGHIEAFGRPLPPGQPSAALAAGIGMVHQHFTLADNLSVLDNVMLGTEPLWWPLSKRAEARAKLVETGQRFGLGVDPDARIADLSVGERQRVEILKALVSFGKKQGARILILDEPTAVLTPAEVESLFGTLRQLVAQGLSVIFISHKLDEVLSVSQRIAILRGGKLIAVLPAAGADKALLAETMVGRQVPRPQRRTRAPGAAVCALQQACVTAPDGRRLLDQADLTLRAGEMVAIAGVAGNGQQALADLLFGLQPLSRGQLALQGRAMPARPRDWVRAGVARIPEDRHAVGVVGDLPVWENAVLERVSTPAFSHAGLVKRGAAQAHARQLIQRFDVRGTDALGVHTPTRALSGGNMQKLILGRALMGAPRPPPAGSGGDPGSDQPPTLIVADQPTWGLDIGAVAYVHQQLLDACAAGSAVLLISEDLDEIFALADRIAVMHDGRLSEARPAAQWALADIGLAMAGVSAGSPHAH
ncbi:MAG: ABC transporter ATP-binding protein [Burkholderiaceae bacterium]|nr:ABC transporter ATP-binding protein [Burkholderiales bacterium]